MSNLNREHGACDQRYSSNQPQLEPGRGTQAKNNIYRAEQMLNAALHSICLQ